MNDQLTKQRVLVGSGDDVKLPSGRVESKPAPARPLNAGQLSVELALQPVQRAKVALDGLLERTSSEFTSTFLGRGEVLPEEGVVDVSCCESDGKERV